MKFRKYQILLFFNILVLSWTVPTIQPSLTLLSSSPSPFPPLKNLTSKKPNEVNVENIPSFMEGKPAAKKDKKKDTKDKKPGSKFDWKKFWTRLSPVLGMMSFVIAIILFTYNELRAVARHCFINRASSRCMDLSDEEIQYKHINKLVYMNSKIYTQTKITDPIIGISVKNSLRMVRNVEMCQYKLFKDQGKLVPTLIWSSIPIKTNVKEYENNTEWPLKIEIYDSEDAKFGCYNFRREDINFLEHTKEPVVLKQELLPEIEWNLEKLISQDRKVIVKGNYLYIKNRENESLNDEHGDIRISYTRIPCQECTIVVGQHEQGFGTFDAYFGGVKKSNNSGFRDIYWIHEGRLVKKEVFQIHDSSRDRWFMAWRLFSIVLGVLGLFLFLFLWKSTWAGLPIIGKLGNFGALGMSIIICGLVFFGLGMIFWGMALSLWGVICAIMLIPFVVLLVLVLKKTSPNKDKEKGKGKGKAKGKKL